MVSMYKEAISHQLPRNIASHPALTHLDANCSTQSDWAIWTNPAGLVTAGNCSEIRPVEGLIHPEPTLTDLRNICPATAAVVLSRIVFIVFHEASGQ
ncbi:hypothetical protein HG15A2_34510 [Adhaeretor mobilis]|uniref:Uncharacterized protein n=1 Tax=Adhaeretor mobilis TaxID=1930276 RepID=A0A517MYZ8_9BACT|nr:hypothetical protein HG15A2_34510 [Adhaeretor mobilis]